MAEHDDIESLLNEAWYTLKKIRQVIGFSWELEAELQEVAWGLYGIEQELRQRKHGGAG
tara:strand:- start:3175 stop:3351 length:177 start_codon:yes stop_codon:yes gene_type:complete